MNKDIKQVSAKGSSPRNIEELEKLALLGEQIAGIAHEINNPLSAILGYSEMLQSMELEPKARKYAHNIYISSMRASKIAEGLLTFLKKKDINLVPTNINDVIQKTLSIFEYQLSVNEISVNLNLSSTSLINGDFHKLQQIFFNLFMNAIQSLEKWGGNRIISISSESLENKVVVIFSDSGHGINVEDSSRIFLPLHTTKKNGTGLGLSIVNSLVKEHDGDISLISNSIGCSFKITFPTISARDKNNSYISESKTKTTTTKRVLIIDDDEIVINAIVGIIKLLGCTVTFITKPLDALEEVQRSNYDIILVDYKMPVMNGVDFIKRASKFVSIEKFILITGYVGLDIKEEFEKYKIPVLHKPIGLDELRHVIIEGIS